MFFIEEKLVVKIKPITADLMTYTEGLQTKGLPKGMNLLTTKTNNDDLVVYYIKEEISKEEVLTWLKSQFKLVG